MKLEELLTFSAQIKGNIPIGAAPYGNRAIAEVGGGTFEGPKLKGKIIGPGADWILMDNQGFGRIDVRLALETDDGANIYMYYTGALEMTAELTAAMQTGKETQFGDNYFVTHVRFETGDQRYAWLNHTVAVGEGRGVAGGVQYRLHRCVPG